MSKYKWKKNKDNSQKKSSLKQLLEMSVVNNIEANLNNSLRQYIGEPINENILNQAENTIDETLRSLQIRGILNGFYLERERTSFNIAITATVSSLSTSRLELKIDLQGWNADD
jgi:poly(3-hydroxyalkanoate) synthetase